MSFQIPGKFFDVFPDSRGKYWPISVFLGLTPIEGAGIPGFFSLIDTFNGGFTGFFPNSSEKN